MQLQLSMLPSVTPETDSYISAASMNVAETVGGPSFRLKDNLIQGIVVVVGTGISAVVGLLMGGTQGLLMGLLGGLVVFGLGSGVVLMVMRMFKKGE